MVAIMSRPRWVVTKVPGSQPAGSRPRVQGMPERETASTPFILGYRRGLGKIFTDF